MRSDAAIRRAFTVTARSNLSPPADVCLRSHEESLVARFALFSFTVLLSLFFPVSMPVYLSYDDYSTYLRG